MTNDYIDDGNAVVDTLYPDWVNACTNNTMPLKCVKVYCLIFSREFDKSSNHSPQICQDRLCNLELKRCEDLGSYIIAYQYIFPIIFALGFLGNLFNILVYNGSYYRTSSTIRMLFAKAIAHIICLMLQWSNFAKTIGIAFDPWYWKTHMAKMFLQNVLGSLSTWLTLSMTIETFIMIVMPLHAKRICTLRNANVAIGVQVVASTLLHIPIMFTKHLIQRKCSPWRPDQFVELITDEISGMIEQVYFWSTTVLTYLVPFIIILVLSLVLTIVFYCKDRRSVVKRTLSSKRESILNMTYGTLMSYLLLEGLGLVLMVRNALHGSQMETLCAVSQLANMLTLVNFSVPCLVYLMCSEKYRQLFCKRFNISCGNGSVMEEQIGYVAMKPLNTEKHMLAKTRRATYS